MNERQRGREEELERYVRREEGTSMRVVHDEGAKML